MLKGYIGTMKALLPAILACVWVVPAIAAEENPILDLGTPPEALAPAPAPTPARQMPTAEQVEQLKKERNWLVEGVKEKQEQRARDAAAANEDKSQSIIDMVMEKQKTDAAKTPSGTPANSTSSSTSRSSGTANTPRGLRPSISTSAFENPASADRLTANDVDMSVILEQERRAARMENRPAVASNSPKPFRRMDALSNPFANLPIPESALPAPRPPMAAAATPSTAGITPTTQPMMPAGQPTPAGGLNPQYPALGGAAASAAPAMGPSGPSGPSTAAAPQSALVQPYDLLRQQEAQRRQQQWNRNRPTVQDLRTPVPDPTQARLF